VKFVAYTCIFDGYDRLFPPVSRDPDLDYVVVTDDPGLRVPGWRVRLVDPAPFGSGRAANRNYKILGQRYFGEYDASVYVDGNIRLLGAASNLLRSLLASGKALGIYRHPRRGSVAEEVAACVERGKTAMAHREFADYREDGFTDRHGLAEAGVLLRNHGHRDLGAAMALWWSLFERYKSRDQFSLPYVLWKTGLPCEWHERSFRDSNPYFGLYPHVGAGHVSPGYAYLCARAYDSTACRLLLELWHGKWWMQRHLRKLRAMEANHD
jgi:hypothetical protein